MNQDREKAVRQSGDLIADRIQQLKQLFPEAAVEGRIDFDNLRLALGEEVDSRQERYSFTWAGKRDAIRLLQTPSRATLVPCPEESVNFETTDNVFIEGENLEVLKLLYKSYAGRVKMIYIDPPYNTGNDFIYSDDFADPLDRYLRITGQKNGEGDLLTTNPETNGRYHSAWLSMMYPRLFVARQLLREDGVIFVSIDDQEVHNLRLILNEVFGEENFVANIIWEKKYTRSNDARWFSDNHDHILVYAKSIEFLLFRLQPRTPEQKSAYSNPDNHPKGPWKATPLHAKSGSYKDFSYVFKNGVRWTPPRGTFPRYSLETLKNMDSNDEIWFGYDGKSTPSKKTFLSNVKEGVTPVTIWPHKEVGHTHEANNELKELGLGGLFNNPKPTRLIRRMMELTIDPCEKSIVLDFFAGSATTAQAVLDENRIRGCSTKFIMIQLPEPTQYVKSDGQYKESEAHKAGYKSISEISKERIRRVIKKLQESSHSEFPLESRSEPEDMGFKVFKLVASNFKPWTGVPDNDPNAYAEQMAIYVDPLVDGWKPENVILEAALREGYSLTAKIEQVPGLTRNRIYLVSDPDKGQRFHICLDDSLNPDDIKRLKLTRDDLFICRDSALDDEKAANLALQCRLKTI